MTDRYDLVIVGAGPAGLSAAAAATEHLHLRTLILDDNPHPGGQIWRNAGELPADPQRAFDHLTSSPNVTIFQRASVVAPLDEHLLLVDSAEGPKRIAYEHLLLATGARERFVPFPGWTLPGVIGAGGLQALVKSGLPVAGKRIVLAGTGPLLLAVADLLKSKGAQVLVIAEQTSSRKLRAFAKSLLSTPGKLFQAAALRLRLHGIPYLTDAYPLRVMQEQGGLHVTLNINGAQRDFTCDYFGCGFHLIPNTELATSLGCAVTPAGFVQVDEQQRTSLPHIYAAGELTGIGGVDKALLEGQHAVDVLTGSSSARLLKPLARARHFVTRLEEAFALRPELAQLATDDTLVCRCEDVPLSRLRGCLNARDAKLQTRCGMGPCQGRICSPILQHLLKADTPLVRPPILPVPIATLAAAADPESEQTS